jgi:hypothetical protein
MPRLTDKDYYQRYRFLHYVWQHYEGLYAELAIGQQIDLHKFYAPDGDYTKKDMAYHRSQISAVDPGLPARASKAYLRLKQFYDNGLNRIHRQHVRHTQKTKGGRKHRKLVGVEAKAVVRPDIDYDKVMQALIEHARTLTKESLTKIHKNDIIT